MESWKLSLLLLLLLFQFFENKVLLCVSPRTKTIAPHKNIYQIQVLVILLFFSNPTHKLN